MVGRAGQRAGQCEVRCGARHWRRRESQASEGKRRRVAARIEEAVEHAMDCGDVDLIAAVQEAIESEKGGTR